MVRLGKSDAADMKRKIAICHLLLRAEATATLTPFTLESMQWSERYRRGLTQVLLSTEEIGFLISTKGYFEEVVRAIR